MSTREKIWHMLEGDKYPWYGRAMTVLIIVSLVPLCFKDTVAAADIVEDVCSAVFILDYALRLCTADLKLKRGRLSFLIYPFTPMAIIDLVSILPTFNVISDSFYALRFLRLLRVLRVFRILRYSNSVRVLLNVLHKQSRLLGLVAMAAVAYILISALVVFNAEPETFDSFFDAIYWSAITLTTVGYGDISPISYAGRAFAVLSSFVGIAIVALPAGIITAGFKDALDNEGTKKRSKRPRAKFQTAPRSRHDKLVRNAKLQRGQRTD